jgi:peptidoglycan/xylan/chitin deacetylase (PgdA/CDA1 family)
MYHSIDYNPVFFTVRPKEFQKQMSYLSEKKYNVISLKKLFECLTLKNIPPKTVVLTFDDGYEDNYFNAFPILKKYNFPATIFLATAFIGKKIPNSAEIPLNALNWDQIKEMHNSGLIDFEPHTVHHPRLPLIPLEEAEKEILESKTIIEEKLNKKCKFFAYPHGSYNSQIQEILKKNNFWAALILGEGLVSPKDDPFCLKRVSIDSTTNFIQFKAKLNFSIEFFNFFKKFLKSVTYERYF